MEHTYFEEYRNIGGIEQYLLHYPVKDAPVLLFIHGGPGSSEANFSYLMRQWWGDMFTIVQWDQRGSGKTLTKNPNYNSYPVTLEAIQQDMSEIIAYLKEHYNREKVILMGHSWGTLLGALHTLNHPEDILLYIAVGQVVNMQQNEKAGYQKVMELATAAGAAKDVQKLKAVGVYPPVELDDMGIKKINTVRKYQQKYGIAMGLTWKLAKAFMKSPSFKFSDISAMMGKGVKANKGLLNWLMKFDLEKYSKDYKVPVCSIQGDNDYQTVTPMAVQYFESVRAPQKQIHIIQNAGHVPMMEQPESFKEALKKALEMLDKDTQEAYN